ncbi:hypothetical protein [Streptomyces sp. NRRL F-5123]|uniref:hypothetical protein n=1 Tax=Streptomyces sp. NRRL F-5123 TaxID=1463856 RepID=UPI0005B994A3|nr:hypothetical protein [Streptomyces sp. NRRL F-5123]
MQHHIRRAALAVAFLAVAAGLAACDGPRKVSGRLDTTRHVAEATSLRKRPHMVKSCHPGTKRVKHTSGRGSSKRTWYTDEDTSVCSSVQHGTESYRHVDSPERWCVRLDDVGGKESRDDVWYRVKRNVYIDAQGLDSGDRMTFVPDHDGC